MTEEKALDIVEKVTSKMYEKVRLLKNENKELKLANKELKKQLNIHSVVKSFYCQSDIEDGGKCDSQCNHCKEYYKPLEQ